MYERALLLVTIVSFATMMMMVWHWIWNDWCRVLSWVSFVQKNVVVGLNVVGAIVSCDVQSNSSRIVGLLPTRS